MNEVLKYDVNSEVNLQNVNDICDLSTRYDGLTNRIKSSLNDVFKNYLDIAACLYKAKQSEIYKFVGYKNLYEYAYNEFELSQTILSLNFSYLMAVYLFRLMIFSYALILRKRKSLKNLSMKMFWIV